MLEMNCNLTDEKRQEGCLCRSMECTKCNLYREKFIEKNKIIIPTYKELEQQVTNLKKQIEEMTSRAMYAYLNTTCKSCKERVVEIAKIGQELRGGSEK